MQQQCLSAALQTPLLDALAAEGTTQVAASPAGDHRSRLHADVALHNATETAAAVGDSANDDGDSDGSDVGDGDVSGGSISVGDSRTRRGGLRGRSEQRVGVGSGGRPLAAHEEGVTGPRPQGRCEDSYCMSPPRANK